MSAMNRPLQRGPSNNGYYPSPPPSQARYGPPSQRQIAGPMDALPGQQRPSPSPGPQGRLPPQGQQLPSTPRPRQNDGFYPQQQPPLQRQPSAPEQARLQRQPSRPNQYPPQQQQPPMPDARYNELPMPPQAPQHAFMNGRPPQGPGLPASDSQATLAPPRSYDTMLIRGKSDDDLDKTDVFWRRFNASAANAQAPDAEKSSWLQKNEGKSSRYYRLMWIVGFFFVLLAAGGIGIGIFLSFRNNNSNVRPDTLGGSANVASAAVTAAGGGGTAGPTTVPRGGIETSSILHVSPTNTVA